MAQCSPSPEEETFSPTAFTVTFESAKIPTTNNKFIKRHIRNLSLPLAKVYDNKVPPTINGAEPNKKPGNHSEGYFSSDPEDEHGQPKALLVKHVNSPTKEEGQEDDNVSEGAPSEAGTYTIDKETPDVVTARLSIDTKFGISDQGTRNSKEWISDWASRSHPGPSSGPTLLPTKVTTTNLVSKIPSPITPRVRLGSRGSRVPGKQAERSRPNSPSLAMPAERDAPVENDTERYLRTTERAMSVLAARMSLSVDSGGESDSGTGGAERRGRPVQRSDSSASESHGSRPAAATTPSSTRYNRAFSLRRGRLDETPKKIESPPVKPLSRVTPSQQQQAQRGKNTPTTPGSLSRTDVTRTSMRGVSSQRVAVGTGGGKGELARKKPAAGGRSNSSLSSKEVEFQNWKRRKSYDPMKAAAEGKKKEAARKTVPPPLMTQSSTNATTTPKSPVNSVLRSASFHTTRQLSGSPQSSSEEEECEEEEDMTLSTEDWPHKISNMVAETMPGGSRGSLYSNNSSGGSPRQRKLEGIDNFIVSAIATISNRVCGNTAMVLSKLRYVFDEESDKYKELSSELEVMEANSEASSSPTKSTSRDLALTLKNLKRLDSAIKVLNNVLFEDIQYE